MILSVSWHRILYRIVRYPVIPTPTHTWDTRDSVDVYVGVELPRPQGFTGRHVSRYAFRRGAVGAHGRAQGHAVLRLQVLIVGRFLTLFLVALSPAHVVDAQEKAVVHDLQLHEELGGQTRQ